MKHFTEIVILLFSCFTGLSLLEAQHVIGFTILLLNLLYISIKMVIIIKQLLNKKK